MRGLIRVTAWERKALWRRLLFASSRVGLLVVVLTVLGVVFVPPCSIFLVKRKISRSVPGVDVVVLPLSDDSVSDAPGTIVSYGELEFEVPWKTTYKIIGKGGLKGFLFGSGEGMLVSTVTDTRDGWLTDVAKDPCMPGASLSAAFPQLIKQPAYDQWAVLLNTTPSSIHVFGDRSEAARGLSLLTFKAIMVPGDLKSGVFSFQYPDKRGFQVGDPHAFWRVYIRVFDLSGRQVELTVAAKKDGRLTQAEVNRVVKTLHLVSGRAPENHESKEVVLAGNAQGCQK